MATWMIREKSRADRWSHARSAREGCIEPGPLASRQRGADRVAEGLRLDLPDSLSGAGDAERIGVAVEVWCRLLAQQNVGAETQATEQLAQAPGFAAPRRGA